MIRPGEELPPELREEWSEAARKAALEARRKKAHGGFASALQGLGEGKSVTHRGVTMELRPRGKVELSSSNGRKTVTAAKAADHAMVQSALSTHKDSLGGRKSYGRAGDAHKLGSAKYHDAIVGAALEKDADGEHGTSEGSVRKREPVARARDTRTAAERKSDGRVTMKQEGGDDGYQYVVRVDGKVRGNGLTRSEASHLRDQHRRKLREGEELPADLRETEAGKPGTNFTQVTPANRARINPIVKHYMAKAHPFAACVRDNRKRFGPRTEQVCAVVKDMGRGTTHWRKGGGKKLSEAEELTEDQVADLFAARLLEAADGDVEGVYAMLEAQCAVLEERLPEDLLTEDWSEAARRAAAVARSHKGGLANASSPRSTPHTVARAAQGQTERARRARERLRGMSDDELKQIDVGQLTNIRYHVPSHDPMRDRLGKIQREHPANGGRAEHIGRSGDPYRTRPSQGGRVEASRAVREGEELPEELRA